MRNSRMGGRLALVVLLGAMSMGPVASASNTLFELTPEEYAEAQTTFWDYVLLEKYIDRTPENSAYATSLELIPTSNSRGNGRLIKAYLTVPSYGNQQWGHAEIGEMGMELDSSTIFMKGLNSHWDFFPRQFVERRKELDAATNPAFKEQLDGWFEKWTAGRAIPIAVTDLKLPDKSDTPKQLRVVFKVKGKVDSKNAVGNGAVDRRIIDLPYPLSVANPWKLKKAPRISRGQVIELLTLRNRPPRFSGKRH